MKKKKKRRKKTFSFIFLFLFQFSGKGSGKKQNWFSFLSKITTLVCMTVFHFNNLRLSYFYEINFSRLCTILYTCIKYAEG